MITVFYFIQMQFRQLGIAHYSRRGVWTEETVNGYVGIRSNNISIKLDGNYYNAEETAESYIYSVELKNYSKKGKFSIDILDGGSVLASGQQFEIEKKGMSQNNMFDF